MKALEKKKLNYQMHLLELMKIKLNNNVNTTSKTGEVVDDDFHATKKFGTINEIMERSSLVINESYLEHSINVNYNNNNNCRNLNDSIAELLNSPSKSCNEDELTLKAADQLTNAADASNAALIRTYANETNDVPLSQIWQLLKARIVKWFLFVCVRFVNMFLPPIQPSKSEKIAYLKKLVF